MDDAEPAFYGVIPKNSAEDVRVALTEFNGHDLVDVRIFTDFRAGAAQVRGPTKNGVSLNVTALPALIEALGRARDEAERRGLIGGGR